MKLNSVKFGPYIGLKQGKPLFVFKAQLSISRMRRNAHAKHRAKTTVYATTLARSFPAFRRAVCSTATLTKERFTRCANTRTYESILQQLVFSPALVTRNSMPLGGVVCRIDSPLEIGVSLPNHVQHRLRGEREKQGGYAYN